MWFDGLWLASGLALLVVGGEMLVRSALSAAALLRVSPLVAGLVIVGFGTSLPELVVSVSAAVDGLAGVAVGNVVGSNISNILLILGLCALICPLQVTRKALRRDGVAVVVASVAVIGFLFDQTLSRVDAAILVAAMAGYIAWVLHSEQTSQVDAVGAAPTGQRVVRGPGLTMLGLALGLGLLIGGAKLFVQGAVGLGTAAGLSTTVVGLTVVAVGTSMPEFMVSVIAALRRQSDVAVGNILGSNLFNALAILGVSGLVSPLAVEARVVRIDGAVMFAASLVLLGFLTTGLRLSRWEGTALVSAYVAYVAALLITG